MKTIILCGGRGTRLNEMGVAVPKALVPIGGKPVIWHLLRIFAERGFGDFVLCLGYLREKIEQYFNEIAETNSKLERNRLRIASDGLNCTVQLVDTGLDTNTGGRIKILERELAREERFFVTYGDGLANVDLQGLLNFHLGHKKTATLTAVHPVSSFGILDLDSSFAVKEFKEKPVLESWINGGFFVFERKIFEYLTADSVLEREPLAKLAEKGELMAYRHTGFWKCMDTYKDNIELNELWQADAPWKVW
jgi:glucose-1-phosphate cytidylyltransferase